jgi:hypothetical protein
MEKNNKNISKEKYYYCGAPNTTFKRCQYQKLNVCYDFCKHRKKHE